MKTLNQYILENQNSEELGFDFKRFFRNSPNIPRSRMPQIPYEHFDDFLIHFANVHTLKKVKKRVGDLKPIQSEVNIDKIKEKISKGPLDYEPKFLLSRYNQIADGHHGLVQLQMEDPDREVWCYRTNLKPKKLVGILNMMKLSYNKDLNDKKIKK